VNRMGAPLLHFPSQPTSFIGREEEIEQISGLLADDGCRLLTLVGPGGIGKTRLAIEAATAAAGDYPDGAHYVPLQPIEQVENILPTVATVLGVQSYESREPADLLFDFLESKHLLLVMDNFEQLVEGSHKLVEILDSASQVKILVTSRVALNLPWEWLVQVKGMRYPADNSGEALGSYSAVALFEERARQVRSSFSAEDEAACVTRICRMVGGMPLGLELAAAWTRALSCEDIAAEIERDLDFLSSTSPGIEERHRSMRAIFERSWRLLTLEEQDVLMKLSVFRGGFDREAAQEVTGSSPATLTVLVDHAFVRLNTSGRYEIHELLRQFAREKLEASPQTRELARDRHCDYYASFLGQREQPLREQWSNRAVMEILEEIDNVRASWAWAIEGQKIEQIGQALRCLGEFYRARNWYREGQHVIGQAAATLREQQLDGENAILLGVALANLGDLTRPLGHYERTRVLLEEAITILRLLHTPQDLADALGSLVLVAFMEGAFQESYRLARERLTISEEIDDPVGVAFGYHSLGTVLRIDGNYQESMRMHRAANSHFRRTGHRLGLWISLSHLGEITQILGDYGNAKRLFDEAHAYLAPLDNRWHLGHSYEYLGRVIHAGGKFAEAQKNLERSLSIARDVGDPRRITFALVGLGDVAFSLGDFWRAGEIFAEALELSRANSQRWQEAWSLLGLGKTFFGQGDLSRANHYLAESLALCRELNWQLGAARALAVSGKVAVTTADFETARITFRQALEIGLEIEVDPLLLEAVAGVSQMLARQGELLQAVALLALALDHPASHADTKHAAAGALAEIEPQMPGSEFKASVQKGKSLDLERTAARLVASLEAGPPSGSGQPLAESLTERELEVLSLVAAGQSNREIARELVIALGTVKTHVHNICGKLNAPNRVKAAARARELGLL